MDQFSELSELVKGVFSWVILLPISVIVSGKLLAQPIALSVVSEQLFKINLKILKIQSTGNEVILGFAGFIITTFILGVFAGQKVYALVKINFGIDPGQFQSICFFGAFLTVLWTAIFFVIHYTFSMKNGSSFIENKNEYEQRIIELKDKGIKG